MMKSMAVVAALAFVTVQAHNGQANKQEREDVDINGGERRLQGGSVDVRRGNCKGRRCLEDFDDRSIAKEEGDDVDINGEDRRLLGSSGRRDKGKGRRLDSYMDYELDGCDRDRDGNFIEDDEGRRLESREVEGQEDKADPEDDGERRLQGQNHFWDRSAGILMGCKMGARNRNDEIFGKVGLYQQNDPSQPVQMRGFFANLPEEFEDYYVQVTSAASGEVYEFVDFEKREGRNRGGFFVGADSELADYDMCLDGNCQTDVAVEIEQFAIMAGDTIQLVSYDDPESSHLGSECVLELKCNH